MSSGRIVDPRLLVIVLAMSLLAACAGKTDEEPVHLVFVERPVESIYNRALDMLNDGNYRMAALFFDEVERQHPYSTWARRAMLFSAYSYYEANKYDDAVNATGRFISLHPGNEHAAYAYYLQAVCYYEQITDVGRDQDATRKASEALLEVMRRFPQSEYAKDAKLKLDMTRDHLAGKEMTVGRFYQAQHKYVAAINRFGNVIEDYQTTTHAPEALHRLTEIYLAMGIDDEALAMTAVLGHNYPGSKWYQRSYALLQEKDLQPKDEKKSWLSRTFW